MTTEAIEEFKDDIRDLVYEIFALAEPKLNGLTEIRKAQYQDKLEGLLSMMDKRERLLPEDYMDEFTDG